MNKFLIDINILLDIIFERDVRSIALIEKLVDFNAELYITASMIPKLDYFLTRYKVDKEKFKQLLEEKFKIISSTGAEALESLNYENAEDALIALSFKRICPDGIIITKNNKFKAFGLKVYSPEEFLELENSSNKENSFLPLLDLKKEYHYMLHEIDQAVLKNIAEGQYILGPEVKELEEKVKEYLGVRHCIGVSSGTDALVLSLRALAIKLTGREYFEQKDEIITTPFTFTATGDAILRAGATPVFVDIDPETYNINPAEIRKYLTSNGSRVVGIVPVHLYGQACNMDEIMDIAEKYNLFVVEDVAQAFGGMWKGKKLGSIGTTGCFSFFPSKNLGCFGDGGMVATNDDEIAELVRMLLKHGGKDKYNVDHIGYNARLDTLQAAILLAKFSYVDEFNKRRRKIAEIYNKELSQIPGIITPKTKEPAYHVYHQYTIRVLNGRRNELQKHLKGKGIGTMVYYPVPLHKMRVFKGRCITYGDLREAEKASQEVLSLPIEPLYSEKEIYYVVEKIQAFAEMNA